MTVSATALTIASTILGVGGQLLQGAAAKRQSDFQSAIAQRNAQVAKVNAERAIEVSQIQQQDQDRENAARLALQEVAQASSGFTLNSKSFARTREAGQRLSRVDSLRIRSAGEIDRLNYENEATNFQLESQAAKARGKASLVQSVFGAGGTLISGALKVRNAQKYATTGSFSGLLT